MKTLSNPFNLSIILLWSILGLLILLLVSYLVPEARKKTSINALYVVGAGIFLGIVGLRADAINNLFFFYLVIVIWNLIAGSLHVFLSGKFLEWPKTVPFVWGFLFALALVLIGFSVLLSFMKIVSYQLPSFFVYYYLSATLTFFIPMSMAYAYECYMEIPAKKYLPPPWIYKIGPELNWDRTQVYQFVVLKYKLSVQSNGPMIISLPGVSPQDMKLGDYFNSTVEYVRFSQDQPPIEVRDSRNLELGWYFFLSDGSSADRLLDPNKTFFELGMKNLVLLGQASEDEKRTIVANHDSEGKSYIIMCKREQEYKSELLTT